MTTASGPLTAGSTIGDWLDHPEGGPLIRGVLGAQGGFDERMLAPVRGLPLQQLVAMSQGQLPQTVVDDLVLQANGGVAPEGAGEPAGRVERVTPGRFEGRTVVVTGAASGIGRATATRVAREGGRVVAVDVNADRLAELVSSVGGEVVPVAGDITQQDDVDRIVAAAGDRID